MSYECPLKYNPADYYIELLAPKVNKKSNLERIKVSYRRINRKIKLAYDFYIFV